MQNLSAAEFANLTAPLRFSDGLRPVFAIASEVEIG